MKSAVLLSVLVGSLASMASGHICLLSPAQRGKPVPANITTSPGDILCFHPEEPCGTSPASGPVATLVGGRVNYIHAVQDLNHYNPGRPGEIIVSLSNMSNPTSDADFMQLRRVPDYWAHLQAATTDFRIPVFVPDVDLSHAVLQIRYKSNKPTEPESFRQCSDVSVTSSASKTSAAPTGTVMALAGAPPATAKLYFAQPLSWSAQDGIPAAPSLNLNSLVADGIAAYDETTDTTYLLKADDPARTDVTNPSLTLIVVGDSVTTLSLRTAAGATFPGQITAIVPSGVADTPLYMLGLTNVTNGFAYQLRTVSKDGTVSDVMAQSAAESTFVNFFFMPTPTAGATTLYFLAGDENSLFKLNVVMYVVDLKAGSMTKVVVDNSAYTIGSIFVANDRVLAVSPGLYYSDHSYSLVEISPSSGDVTAVGQIAPAGRFAFNYFGFMYGQAVSTDGSSLRYLFVDADTNARVLATINTTSGALSSAIELDTGVNHQIMIKTPIYVPASSRFSL